MYSVCVCVYYRSMQNIFEIFAICLKNTNIGNIFEILELTCDMSNN